MPKLKKVIFWFSAIVLGSVFVFGAGRYANAFDLQSGNLFKEVVNNFLETQSAAVSNDLRSRYIDGGGSPSLFADLASPPPPSGSRISSQLLASLRVGLASIFDTINSVTNSIVSGQKDSLSTIGDWVSGVFTSKESPATNTVSPIGPISPIANPEPRPSVLDSVTTVVNSLAADRINSFSAIGNWVESVVSQVAPAAAPSLPSTPSISSAPSDVVPPAVTVSVPSSPSFPSAPSVPSVKPATTASLIQSVSSVVSKVELSAAANLQLAALTKQIEDLKTANAQRFNNVQQDMAYLSQITSLAPRASVPLTVLNPTFSGTATGLGDDDIPNDITVSSSNAISSTFTTGTSTFSGGVLLATTAGNVGIGTDTPASHKVGIAGPILVGGGSTSTFESNMEVWGNLQLGQGTLVLTQTDMRAGNGFTMTTQSAEQNIVLQSAGRVGVSSSTPWGVLSVEHNGADDDMPVLAVGDSGTSSPAIVVEGGYEHVGFGTSSPYGQVSIEITGDPNNAANESLPAFVISSRGTSTPAFYVRGDNGNVGIGTTTPTNAFEVNGSALIGSNLTIVGVLDVQGGLVTSGSLTPPLGLRTDTPVAHLEVAGDGLFKGGLYVQATTTASSLIATSTLSVGTTTPGGGTGNTNALSVGGNTYIDGGLGVGVATTTSGGLFVKGSADIYDGLIVRSGGTDPSLFVKGRKVGIGTVAPAADLEVKSGTGEHVNVRLSTGSSDGSATLTIARGGTSAYTSLLTFDTTASVGLVAGNTGALFIGNSGLTTKILTVNTSTNNVGIARTNPSTALEVVGTTTVSSGINILGSQLYVGNGKVATSSIYGQYGNLGFASTTTYGQFSIEAQQEVVGSSTPIFVVGDQGSSSPFIYVSGNNGNIGIGVDEPAVKLDMMPVATNETGIRVRSNINVGNYAEFGFQGNNDNGIINCVAGGPEDRYFAFQYNGATKMVLTPSGNFGIATVTPTLKLEVAGGGLFKGNLWTAATSTASAFVATSTLNVGTTSPSTNSQLSVVGNAYIDGGLGVGQATTSSGSLLVKGPADVIGNLTVREFMDVTNTGATSTIGGDLQIGSGVNSIVFLNSGRVGIGSPTPHAILDLSQDSASGGDGSQDSEILMGSSGRITTFQGGGRRASIQFGDVSNDSEVLILRQSSTARGVYVAASGTALPTSYVLESRFGVDLNTFILGNLSVGNNSADVRLDVAGTTTVSSGINILGSQLYVGNGKVATSSIYGQYGNLGFASTTPFGQVSIEADEDVVGSSTPIFVVGDQGTSTPSIYVEGGYGRVGFGTSSPYGQVSIEITGDPNNDANEGLPAFVVSARGTSTPAFFISNSNGNVGVATASPGTALDVSGVLNVSSGINTQGRIGIPAGSASAPSLFFSGDSDTGLYDTGPGYLVLSTDGVGRAAAVNNGFHVRSDGSFGWAPSTIGSGVDTYLYRDAANTLALRNSTNAQEYRLYNTFTDASNLEYLSFRGNSTDKNFVIEPVAKGTGNQRNLALLGGAVGIGTTSPYGLFSIEATSTGFEVGSSTPIFVVSDSGTSSPFIYVSGINGNVGIATDNPWVSLQVGDIGASTGNTPGSAAANVGVFVSAGGGSDLNGGGQIMLHDDSALAAGIGGAIAFSARSDTTQMATMAGIRGLRENGTAGNFSGYLQFSTRSGTGANREVARITSDGYLCVATDTPEARLAVVGAGLFKGGLYVQATTTTSSLIATSTLSVGTTTPGGGTGLTNALSVGGNTYIDGGLGVGAATTSSGGLFVKGTADVRTGLLVVGGMEVTGPIKFPGNNTVIRNGGTNDLGIVNSHINAEYC